MKTRRIFVLLGLPLIALLLMGGAAAGIFPYGITSPSDGQVLTYNGTSTQWENKALPAAGVTSITGTAGQITASSATGAVTLSIPSAMTGINSVTSVAGQAYTVGTGTSGTGLSIASATNAATFTPTAGSATGQFVVTGASSATANSIIASITGTNTATSGTNIAVQILPTYNQSSGTAANTDLLVNRTSTAVGSGAQLLFDFQVAGVSKIKGSTTGAVTVTDTFTITTGGMNIAGDINNSTGDFKTNAVGKTLVVKSGTNAKSGTFTLSSGTVTVSNTSVTTGSVVCCTVKTSSGTLGTGTPEIVITAGTGFTATGIATDNSTYNFVIFEVN